jgi:hypothetical protein
MGAFFLFHKDSRINTSSVEEVYSNKGFGPPHISEIGDFRLYLYRKQLLNTDNYLYARGNAIYACGSLFYKESGYTESLTELLDDFLNNRIDPNRLYGNFILIFFCGDNGKIAVYTDASVLKNIYCDKKAKILSTDFLALLSGTSTKCTLNLDAIVENLTTGNLISPDTYITEIERVDKINISDLDEAFPGISFANLVPDLTVRLHKKDIAIHDANRRLENYFKSARKISEQFYPHLGLTGGFDTRLLLVHAKKYLQGLITNSFWRPESIEYNNAKLLADRSGTEFVSFEKVPFDKPPKRQIIGISYYFFDGQVRSQNNWLEEFSLPEYSRKISAGHHVGFHGCGGEQYRNSERISGKIRFDDFIYYDWMFKQCNNVFKDSSLMKITHNRIKEKMIRLTGISGEKGGLNEIKRIQNEVWIPSNRMTRVNVLNQQQFYFAPFTEYHISHAAYACIPFLGGSSTFEIEMIRSTDMDLSSVMTNYGYSVFDGEPLIQRILSRLAGIAPRALMYKIYYIIRKRKDITVSHEGEKIELSPVLSELKEKIDFTLLRRNRNLGWTILAFNEFINRFYKLQ